jgi:uncharacterized protein with PQ loop repeat
VGMVIAWVPQVDLHLVIALNNMVEMLISQIIAILRRRSSEGVSFWMILLANISGITGLLNGFVLQWHVVHCCLQEVRRLATHTLSLSHSIILIRVLAYAWSPCCRSFNSPPLH